MKKLLAVLIALLLCFGMTACKEEPTTTDDNANETTKTTAGERDNNVDTAYPDKKVGFQLEMPEKGEEIAIMHTSMGDIHIRFFPEGAPKAVENFKTLAKQGYYNGTMFHRVIADFMIQGGDPKGDGTGGESSFGEDFEDEFDSKLLNLYGSIAMANGGPNTNGSQFFINQKDEEKFGDRETYTPEYHEEYAKTLYQGYLDHGYTAEQLAERGINSWKDFINETYVYDWIPEEVWDVYLKHGGNLHLDGAFRREGGHTVFGQVFLGMNVVESIAAVETDDNAKPKTPVTVKSIEITEYKG